MEEKFIEQIKKYVEMGIPCFPVRGKKSLVAWKQFQERLPTAGEMSSWNSIEGVTGIAGAMGKVCGGMIIDCDIKDPDNTCDPEIIKRLKAEGYPETLTGSKGSQFLVQWDSTLEYTSNAGVLKGLDIKAQKGYVLLPPSEALYGQDELEYAHFNGNKYEWIKEWRGEELKPFPVWLLDLIKSKKPKEKLNYSEAIKGTTIGNRNDLAVRLIGKYLYDCKTDEDFAVAWEAIKAWNTQCQPPLPEEELKNKFDFYANKNRKEQIETGTADRQVETEIENEWTPAISLMELLNKNFPEKKWTVENIFQRGTINQLSAPPQQWKTWLTQYMAICIATGEKVFGNFSTDKQNVMMVNEEDPEFDVKERLSLILGEIKDLPVYVHAEKGIKLEGKTVTKLIEEAKEKEIGVIIFDSLSVIHNADENSAKEMGLVFEQMKRFSRKGITVIFTNHHRKKSMKKWEKDDIQEQTRGSTVINAVPSGHITCEEKIQDGNHFIIIRQAKLKGAKKIDPFSVKIEISDTKIGFSYECKHEESLDAATRLRNELYEIIQKSETWLGIKDYAEMVGKSESPVRDQIKALLTDKHIQDKTRATLVKEGAPVSQREKPSGQEFLYFRIDSPAGDKLIS